MDLLKMGQELLGDKLGDNAGGVMEALSGLTSGDGLDLGGITSKLQEGGLGDQLQSWLGDGDNAEVSADEVSNAFGQEQIAGIASKLGVSEGEAANTLKDALPGLLDKVSAGGSITEQFGSAEGLMGAAKGMLGK